MRGLILFVIGLVIAQGSWAITALDTLIIDGEQVYVEPTDKHVDESFVYQLEHDRRQPLPHIQWGIDAHAGVPFQSTSFTLNPVTNWQTLAQFSNNSPTQKFGFQYGIHAFVPLRQFIPIENVDIQLSVGADYATSSFDVMHTRLDTSLNTIAFQSVNGGIQQIYLVELQPGTFETDTINMSLLTRTALVRNLSIPLYARFYLNSFSNKNPVRAYMSLGAVYRSYSILFNQQDSDLLLVQSNGDVQINTAANARVKFWSPMLSLGLEYKWKDLGMFYAQFNTNGAPVNKSLSNNTYVFKQKGLQWSVGLRFNF